MEVIVESLLSGSVSGRSVVSTVGSATVDSVITAFCAERGIGHKSKYILTDSDDVVLENSYTLNMCRVSNGDTLYLTARDGHEATLGFHNWWLMVIVSMVIGSVGLVAICLMYVNPNPAIDDFGLVFDAGSTHTLMHVYRWPGGKSNGTGEPYQIGRCQINSGIAQYAETPSKVGELLRPCIERAKLEMVPQGRISSTLIYLGATGGMRLLEIRNKTESDAVILVARHEFKSSGFSYSVPEQVRILSGTEEGVDAWVTANYLNGSLVPGRSSVTVGTLDMGGASMQVAFELPVAVTDPDVTVIEDFGKKHDVFSLSYLCYGAKEANRRRTAQLLAGLNISSDDRVLDPCLPKGFEKTVSVAELFTVPCANMSADLTPSLNTPNVTLQGTGDAVKCSVDVKSLFNFTACSRYSFAYCYEPPKIPLPDIAFMAVSAFDYVMTALNFTDFTPSLPEFESAIERVCGRTQALPGNETLCFQAVYVRAALLEGFAFNSSTWRNLVFIDYMKDTDVDWALGYMMNETNSMAAEVSYPRLQMPAFIVLVLCFVAFLLLAVGFGVHACRLRSASPSYQRFSQYGAI